MKQWQGPALPDRAATPKGVAKVQLLVAIMLAASVGPAHAQMADAIGKPLPAPDVEAGTVSVRIVAGKPSSPVIGTEVTLVVNGATRIARTDTAGRAFFKDLPPGAQVQAKVLDDDKKEVSSEVFALPASGGTRLMLTTRPWTSTAGGSSEMPAGGQGMPNPRQMSGEPRPEGADQPGTLTARLTYDDFKDAPPVGVPVALVGYRSNDLVDLQVVNTDAEGRAAFKGLDRTGGTAYFAMTLLERGGKYDRLISVPAVLDSRAGVRVILSADKRTSTAPSLDDLTRFEKQESAPAAGKIRVGLEGGVEATAPVSLVEITQLPGVGGKIVNERRVFATGKAKAGPPDPSEIQAQAEFTAKPDVPVNTVVVSVHGGVNATNSAIEGIAINVASAATFEKEQGRVDGTTDASGSTKITVDPKTAGPFLATLTINGKTLTSKPFELTTSGGVLDVEAHWSSEGKPQVEFDLVPRPGQVFYAETVMHNVLYRSLPFQPVPERGTRVSLFIYPRVLFTFSLTSRVDDEYLGVNGRFEVSNNAWAPYLPPNSDGILLPLPKGFVGGQVAEKDQTDVALVPGEGFRIVRPLAPGARTFHGAFSLTVEDGRISWRQDLPYGLFNSGMEILQAPGMTVTTQPGVTGQTMTVPQGTYFVLPNLSLMPKQQLALVITGLPQPPAWKIYLPRVAAAIVVLLLVGGIVFTIYRKRDPTEGEREERRQKLMDELVELERSGKDAKRREQIMAELESLWDAA